MSIVIKTERTFDSAHLLPGYKGKCSSLHGHTYRVIVWVRKESWSQEEKLLWDFAELKRLAKVLDHKYLNELIDYPSAENIADWFYQRIKIKGCQVKVRLYESPKSYAEVGDW